MRRLLLLALVLPILACGGGGGGGGGGGSVDPEPQPFAPADDLATTLEATAVDVPVLANDGDFEVSPEVTLLRLPERGDAEVLPDGSIRYRPDDGFNGTDTFRYAAAAGLESGEGEVHVCVYAEGAEAAPVVHLPRLGLGPREIAVLLNEQDPKSVTIGEAWASARGVPDENVVRLSFDPQYPTLTVERFEVLKAQVDAAVGPRVQAFAIAWTQPWRVSGMSVTSAFALGWDEEYQQHTGQQCDVTTAVDYFASESTRPFNDHGIRPAMMLAAETTQDGLALVDRGIAADFTFPTGLVILQRTNDTARSVRWPNMELAETFWDHLPDGLDVRYYDRTAVPNGQTGVLGYQTGAANVNGIDTHEWLPGAFADHMTSLGGVLDTSDQMTVFAWLAAGATASFGTVAEPCNYPQKFPNPLPLLAHYFRGNTILEAYWKSVEWPGQGLFVGEPLARPFGRHVLTREGTTIRIVTTCLSPNEEYRVVAADAPDGPVDVVLDDIRVPWHRAEEIVLPNATRALYRLEQVP